MKEAEERRRQIEEEQEKEREMRKQLEREKEQQREQVLILNDTKQKQRIDEFTKKFNEKDEILHKIQIERQTVMTEKRNTDTLKRLDKRENVERIKRRQEYDRHKLQEKLNEKMERADKLQGDLSVLLVQRQNMRREIEKQKRDIMGKFEKLREGKLPPQELQKQLGVTPTDKLEALDAGQQLRSQSQGKPEVRKKEQLKEKMEAISKKRESLVKQIEATREVGSVPPAND